MTIGARIVVVGVLALAGAAALRNVGLGSSPDQAIGRDPQLDFPEHYREWVYLSTGFDMSYQPMMKMSGHLFDNVFVNPEAYKAYVASGVWPDKTVLVLEVRGARSKGSINQSGHYQDTEVVGVEVHAKDEKRFPGQWAFFIFGRNKAARYAPRSADCYSCHAAHGAVDTTFVQFYPTLLPVATAKGTLSQSYQKDVAKPAGK
jgi:hypothetical protein